MSFSKFEKIRDGGRPGNNVSPTAAMVNNFKQVCIVQFIARRFLDKNAVVVKGKAGFMTLVSLNVSHFTETMCRNLSQPAKKSIAKKPTAAGSRVGFGLFARNM